MKNIILVSVIVTLLTYMGCEKHPVYMISQGDGIWETLDYKISGDCISFASGIGRHHILCGDYGRGVKMEVGFKGLYNTELKPEFKLTDSCHWEEQ